MKTILFVVAAVFALTAVSFASDEAPKGVKKNMRPKAAENMPHKKKKKHHAPDAPKEGAPAAAEEHK